MERDTDTFLGKTEPGGPASQESELIQDGNKDEGLPKGCKAPDGPVLTYWFICSRRGRGQRARDERWMGQRVWPRQIPRPHPFSLTGQDTPSSLSTRSLLCTCLHSRQP